MQEMRNHDVLQAMNHLPHALRRRRLSALAQRLARLGAVVLALATIALGAAHAQENQIVTYGPWKGYWTQARLSAYSPHDALDREYHESKGAKWRWITADGKTDVRHRPHGVAAPRSLPFGTRVFIPTGHGYLDKSRPSAHERSFILDDRGSAIESGASTEGRLWLDLRYRTEHSALAFGVKDAWVFIITADN